MNSLLRKIKSCILFQYYTQYEPRATLMVTSQKKLKSTSILRTAYCIQEEKMTCLVHMDSLCNG